MLLFYRSSFLLKIFSFIFLMISAHLSHAQEYPQFVKSVWQAPHFQFHTGEVLDSLSIGYVTLGNPSNPAVLILHGTAGNAMGMLNRDFGQALFLKDQPLDAQRYFIIIPDAIGVGQSSKPSDGLKAQFPHYNYADMVNAQYRLVTEGLKVQHLKLILGNSMGGMQAWLWGTTYPDIMQYLVPMASTPMAMSGRNWMLRRMMTELIRHDPSWQNGNYEKQPEVTRWVNAMFGLATSGGTQHLQSLAPSSEAGDQMINDRLKQNLTLDTNDFLYQWESSSDFDPSSRLHLIKARVLAINSADDERNPPEIGVMTELLSKIPAAKLLLIPASKETSGHSTTGQARWWKEDLRQFIKE
jgi:homoserine O-acetyltransferase/O-succinyltransferase